MSERHINIPVFIPHMGCPNQCVFCDQRVISGAYSFQADSVRGVIDEIAEDARTRNARIEIAFFGGSFTGIERDLMIKLLDIAEEYVSAGISLGTRMSTRPDYIDGEIINILSRYTVTEVELGVQSMSETVLSVSKRGHTADDTRRAVGLLNSACIPWGGQMMLGLPGSLGEDERKTAEFIAEHGASSSRIYPTAVFRGTELDAMMKRGEYSPLSLSDAVERGADALEVFARHGVRVLRIGLADSERLHSSEFTGGINHPAVGELIRGEVYRRRIAEAIESGGLAGVDSLTVYCPVGESSAVIGQRKANKLQIQANYNIKNIKIVEKQSLLRYNIMMDHN